MMLYSLLPQRGVISLSGEDAHDFLQGLVSNDVRPLRAGRAVYAALLSPQGKFLHDFFLVPHGEAILMDCAHIRLPDLLQRLKMYKLRSKVAIEALPDMRVATVWHSSPGFTEGSDATDGDPAPKAQDDVIIYPDPRLPALGWRMIGQTSAIEAVCHAMEKADAAAYERRRIELGVPDGSADMIADKSLLLEFGFEDLHGVDFAKGCYVGQEVTARSKYRGQVRRFIYQVTSVDGDLPESGTPVTLEGAASGELRSHAGKIGLAQLRVADVGRAQSSGMKFVCGNAGLTASLPGWVMHPPKALEAGE